jgi:arabinose-5-phosphate isomerase
MKESAVTRDADSSAAEAAGPGAARRRERVDAVEYGRTVVRTELDAVRVLLDRLDERFLAAVEAIRDCTGRTVVTGMGKPGIIAEKISATMASTGTPSLALNPADAYHGDLGRVVRDDVVIILSNSGETSEVTRLLNPLKKIGATTIAITGNAGSTLARHCDILLDIGEIPEACPIGLAPTASTTAMLVIGDALAMTVARLRDFTPEEYAFYHPGGSLGRRLLKVSEIMRTGEATTVVLDTMSAREALIAINRTKGRPGAASVVDADGVLCGFVTDGDLARRLEKGLEFLGAPVSDIMASDPKTVSPEQLASEALRILREHKIDQLPVVDAERRPVGLLDVQDLLGTGGV